LGIAREKWIYFDGLELTKKACCGSLTPQQGCSNFG